MLTLLLLVILVALVFEFINGFHDTANSIATVVATKVLTPTQAVMLAAVTNLVGAFSGTAVAKTISSGLVDTGLVTISSEVLICALTGAIIWNLITWALGLPSSSSHALIGGLCGAALAAGHNNFDVLIWSKTAAVWTENKGILWKVLIPMVSSPIAGFTLGIVIMGGLMAIISGMNTAGGVLARMARPKWINAVFGKAQLFSAGYMGFAHGSNDAQKTMGIIALAIFSANSAGTLDQLPAWADFLRPDGGEKDIDTWIVFACALIMALGTAVGGWRIIRTLGHKMVKLHPDQRFRGGNQLSHHSVDRRPFRYAGFHHAQHFNRDYGRRFCQESSCAKAFRHRTDCLGLGFDNSGGGGGIVEYGEFVIAVAIEKE